MSTTKAPTTKASTTSENDAMTTPARRRLLITAGTVAALVGIALHFVWGGVFAQIVVGVLVIGGLAVITLTLTVIERERAERDRLRRGK